MSRKSVPKINRANDSIKMDSLDHITFPSCEHLRKLLVSPARDLVIKNYNLSIKVSCLTYPQPGLNYNNLGSRNSKSSKHLSVDKRKLLKVRATAVKCSNCKNNLSVNLICLQCPHVGCYTSRHAVEHSQSTHHLFAISTFGQVFCFKCNDYVSNNELEKIRISSLQNTDRVYNNPGMPIFPFVPSESKKIVEENSKLPSFKASLGLKGIVNMGSTCYMSTIIQTFVHNPFVREYFLSGAHINCSKNNDLCVTCRIDEVFVDFYGSNSVAAFGLTKFLATCWRINRSLAGSTQQDAHEFWQFCLGEFHKSHVLEAKKKSNGNSVDLDTKINKHTRSSSISFGSNEPCDCLTHKIFSGELQSSIKCSACENTNKTVDPMIDLLLEIKSKKNGTFKSLDECFNWFTKPETLESSYNCNFCNKKTSASKKLSVKKLGPILSIQLKRFEQLPTGVSVKVEDPVSYPVILDMSKYVTTSVANSSSIGQLTYELFAIVCHIGQVNTGHYVCLIKNGDGQWFKFDDSMVTLVTQKEALSMESYLLFYIKHQFP